MVFSYFNGIRAILVMNLLQIVTALPVSDSEKSEAADGSANLVYPTRFLEAYDQPVQTASPSVFSSSSYPPHFERRPAEQMDMEDFTLTRYVTATIREQEQAPDFDTMFVTQTVTLEAQIATSIQSPAFAPVSTDSVTMPEVISTDSESSVDADQVPAVNNPVADSKASTYPSGSRMREPWRPDVYALEVENREADPVRLQVRLGEDEAGKKSPPLDRQIIDLKPGFTTTYHIPHKWIGVIAVGNQGPGRSLIEPGFGDQAYIDISYVDGYTYPVTCSFAGTETNGWIDEAFTGCNHDLWAMHTCPEGDLRKFTDGSRSICLNRAPENGPATPFFAPCQGSAYTYPADNKANVGGRERRQFKCCIGTTCEAPIRQKS